MKENKARFNKYCVNNSNALKNDSDKFKRLNLLSF